MRRSLDLGRAHALAGAMVACVTMATPALAQSRAFDVPAGPASRTVPVFARQAGMQIIGSGAALAGKQTPAIKGTYPVADALALFLAGTGLRSTTGDGGIVMLSAAADDPVQDGTLAGGSAALADESGQVGQNDIIVTANKKDERLQDVAMAASAVSGEQLVRTQTTTLREVLEKLPGVQLIGNSAAENEIVVRGLSVRAGINSSVATYVDEVPYTTSGPRGYSVYLAPNISPFDMSRVELLRGPQGTLYGATALGGLLKYVTNAPDPTGWHAAFLTEVDSVEHGGVGYEGHAMVNAPLSSTLALRLVGDSTLVPGYIDDPYRGANNINYLGRLGGRASLLWKPLPNLSIRLTAQYQRVVGGGDSTEDVYASNLQPIRGDLTQSRARGSREYIKNQIYNGVVDFDDGTVHVTSSTSFIKGQPYLLSDYTPFYGPFLSGIFGQNLGALLVTTNDVDAVVQEVRFASSGNHRLEWLLGSFLTSQLGHQVQAIYPIDLGSGQVLYNFSPSIGTFAIRSTYKELAAFGDLTLHLTPKLEISGGGRFSANDQTFHFTSGGFLGGNRNYGDQSNDSVFTYSGDIKYRLDGNNNVYARIASGYVPGGPNARLPQQNSPATYGSSTTTNYEVGIKGAIMGRRLQYDLDVFDVEWRNIQIYNIINGFSYIGNGGRARSRGVEGSVNLTVSRGLNLGLNGAYIDARLTQDDPAFFGGLAGDRLPFAPLFSGSASADYDHSIGRDLSMVLGAQLFYNGKRLATFDPSGFRPVIPAFAKLDLRAGLRRRGFAVTAFVKNVTDSRGFNDLASIDVIGVSADAYSAAVQPPRTFGLQFEGKF